MRSLVLVAALVLLPGAGFARGRAASPRAVAAQARKLRSGEEKLEKLRNDPRRRKYRDGWEAVLRDLDGAVKAAPNGPRAAEAALAAARARADLWEVSRSPVDARAALSALRKVDEDYPGPTGAQALAAALAMATRVHDAQQGATIARRLAERYPQDAKAISPPADESDAKAPARKQEATASRRPEPPAHVSPKAVQKPVEVGDDEEDDSADSAPATPAPATAAAKREGEVDVGREAAKVIEEMLRDAKAELAQQQATAAPRTGAPAAEKTAAAPQTTVTANTTPAPAPASAKSAPATASAKAKAASADADDSADDDDEPPEPEAPENPPSHSTPIVRAVKNAVAALTEPDDAPTAAAKARELRSTALSSPATIAEQLGLKVRRIVVDAGHGGRDTGAIGPHGGREKEMTLSIARKVAQRLKALGFTVIMTRTSDTYVALDDRTRIANEAKADLFVSIHCNAAKKRTLSGVETWTLNVSSDRYSTRLAAFENAEADRRVSDLRMILADLATKANASDAHDLAESVQSSLVRTLRSRVGPVKDHGIKQALFYVLLGTHMPSILVETAFISNPAEEKRLRNPRFQEGTAEAIARGVKDYVDSRQRLARAP